MAPSVFRSERRYRRSQGKVKLTYSCQDRQFFFVHVRSLGIRDGLFFRSSERDEFRGVVCFSILRSDDDETGMMKPSKGVNAEV